MAPAQRASSAGVPSAVTVTKTWEDAPSGRSRSSKVGVGSGVFAAGSAATGAATTGAARGAPQAVRAKTTSTKALGFTAAVYNR